jgi:predicted dehydrogenase
MSKKIRWGVLSTASIGVRKVLPAMRQGQYSEVTAIASRDLTRARQTASQLGIAKAYGSYQELVDDPQIDAIYNPLPNQLHVPWTIKAAEAGKHVLCEKPLSLTVAEAESLLVVRERTSVKIGEAFMIRSHPQWLRAKAVIDSGRIGDLRCVMAAFSYFNIDPKNIRNHVESGGGALYDIGCYCIQSARYGFGAEPTRVVGCIDRDPTMGTDRLTSAMLEFDGGGQAIFNCSTQLVPHQRVHFFGTKGRIEIEIPFNAPKDRPTRLFIDGGDLFGADRVTEEFPICDQYTLQGDEFSRAILDDTEVPVPLEEAIRNMKVIEAIFRSAKAGQWVTLA